MGFYATDEGCVCVCVWAGGGGGEISDWDVMLHCVVYVSVQFSALCRVFECKYCCTVSRM